MSVHRIETLTLDLRHANGRAALASQELQERLLRFVRTTGLGLLEDAFERLGPGAHARQLAHLELDLGRIRSGQDEADWARQLRLALDDALVRLLQPGAPALPLLNEVDRFLACLLQGHRPWGLPRTPEGSLSRWLAVLARQQGPLLWRALERHPAGHSLLQRLQALSPPDGVQALLEQRDPGLGRQLQQLDQDTLAPLQAAGRLSAYERQRLQQSLRGEALTLLWEARGRPLGLARRQRLLRLLQAQLSRALGAQWQTRLQAMVPPQQAPGLLRELLSPAQADGLSAAPEAAAGARPGRVWEAGLQGLRRWLEGGRRLAPPRQDQLLRRLQALGRDHGPALRQRLLDWLQSGPSRRRWALALDPAHFAVLLGCLLPARPAAGATAAFGPATASQPWAESLRQTALRLQAAAPAGQRPGLSRLQQLLMEACLGALARGERLPDSHAGWQRFWQAAWQRWADPASGEPGAPPPRADTPATAPIADEAPARPPLPPQAAEPAPPAGTEGTLDRALKTLARHCEAGRWAWPERLRLSRLLSSETACRRWLQLFDESQRWQMIRAQFGRHTQALRLRADRLLQGLGQALREPAARLAEHWRRLCRFLFLQEHQPDARALRCDYQAQPLPEPAQSPAEPLRADEPIWVDDAGQVLLSAYAERLFKQLDLLNQGRFSDASACAVAVQCLQTLCHGERPRDICDTVLSRLLCGREPGDLLPAPPPLPAATTALLEQLLQAVIGHWKALGRASAAGLRETFLRRPGRLMRERPTRPGEPGAWRLQVEKRGVDVLLDRLPWGFSTIRLPWMEGVLHVEWR